MHDTLQRLPPGTAAATNASFALDRFCLKFAGISDRH